MPKGHYTRFDKATQDKYLSLRQTGLSATGACEVTGVDYKTVYNFRIKNPDFAALEKDLVAENSLSAWYQLRHKILSTNEFLNGLDSAERLALILRAIDSVEAHPVGVSKGNTPDGINPNLFKESIELAKQQLIASGTDKGDGELSDNLQGLQEESP